MFNSGIFSPPGVNSGSYIQGSGTLNYIAKWTPDGSTLGDSQIFDNGTNITIDQPGLFSHQVGTIYSLSVTGNATFSYDGNYSQTIAGTFTSIISADATLSYEGNFLQGIDGTCNISIGSTYTYSVDGSASLTFGDDVAYLITGDFSVAVDQIIDFSATSTLTIKSVAGRIINGTFAASTSGAVSVDTDIAVPTYLGANVLISVSAKNTGATKAFSKVNLFLKADGSTSVNDLGTVSTFATSTATVTYPNTSTIRITVTGEAAENIDWVVDYKIVVR